MLNDEDQILKLLAERILTLRKEEDYYQVSVDTEKGLEDIAPPQLIGNLGGISFHADGAVYGQALIAASARIKYRLSDYLKEEGIPLVMVNATEGGEIFSASEGGTTAYYCPRFEVTKGRTHDSEYILLHFLDAFLQESGKRKGKLYLLTERIPCASCTRVINWFCGEYNGIQVEVYYLLNTARRTHVDGQSHSIVRNADNFYADCSSQQVGLNWVALNGDTVDTGKFPRGVLAASIEWKKADIE